MPKKVCPVWYRWWYMIYVCNCMYVYIYISVCVYKYLPHVYLIFADVQVFSLFWGFYMFFFRWIMLPSVVSKEPALIMSFGEPFLHISSLAEACTNNAGPAFTNAWRAIKQRPWWNIAVGKVVGWKNHGTHMKSQLLGKWKASCSFSLFLFDHYLCLKGQHPLFPGDEVTA